MEVPWCLGKDLQLSGIRRKQCCLYLGGRGVWVGGQVGGGQSSGVAIRRVGCLLSRDVLVDGVEGLRQGAVHIEPPVTDQILLVEHCPSTTK